MDTLQQDIDTLEQEKIELKERLKILSKKTLIEGITRQAKHPGNWYLLSKQKMYCYFNPCKQSGGGGLRFTLSLCLCVSMCNRVWSIFLAQRHFSKFTGKKSELFVSGLYFSYGGILEFSTSHNNCV